MSLQAPLKPKNSRSRQEFTESLDGEVWKKVQGYETRYEVSTHGRVRTNAKGTLAILRPYHDRGYKRVRLCDGRGSCVWHQVHRLVATCFLQESDRPWVNHIDGNPSNNHYSNLEWVTPRENDHHARHVLGRQWGEQNPSFGKCGPLSKKSREFVLVSPSGQVWRIKGLVHFCKQHGLEPTSLNRVARKQLKQSQGWKAYYPEDPDAPGAT